MTAKPRGLSFANQSGERLEASPRAVCAIPGTGRAQQLVALLRQMLDRSLLLLDAPRHQLLVSRARIGGGLLDELAQVFPGRGKAGLDSRDEKSRLRVAPSLLLLDSGRKNSYRISRLATPAATLTPV